MLLISGITSEISGVEAESASMRSQSRQSSGPITVAGNPVRVLGELDGALHLPVSGVTFNEHKSFHRIIWMIVEHKCCVA